MAGTSRCKFSGLIQEIPGLSVDSFEKENFEKCSTFFLTHCHSDHMQNLLKEFESNINSRSDLRLFCSAETEIILRNKLNWEGEHTKLLLDKVVKQLNINQELTITIDGMEVQVTAIRANHCAGSCMFLFKTGSGAFLYTGDFRFHYYELNSIAALHDEDGSVIALDNIYLDTTFFNQITYHFPSRKRVMYLIMKEIDEYMAEAGDAAVVHITRPASIGSEIIIRTLARKYGRPIHVEWDAFYLYHGIDQVLPYITSDASEAFIHMCKEDEAGTNEVCSDPNALKIHPTALWYAFQRSNSDWVHRDGNGKIKIAHSMHSSRKELHAFINYFKPSRAVALVTRGYGCEKVQSDLDQLIQRAKTGG